MQKGSLPPIHPRISPKIPNPTHRFCYRTLKDERYVRVTPREIRTKQGRGSGINKYEFLKKSRDLFKR